MVMQIQKRDSDMILLHHHLLGIRCNHGMHLCKNFMIGDCIYVEINYNLEKKEKRIKIRMLLKTQH